MLLELSNVALFLLRKKELNQKLNKGKVRVKACLWKSAVLLYIVNLPKLCKTRKNIWIIFIYCLSFFNLWKDQKRLFLRKYYYFTSKIRNMKDYVTYEHTKSKCQKCRVINEWVQINVTDRSQTHSNILLIRKRKKLKYGQIRNQI